MAAAPRARPEVVPFLALRAAARGRAFLSILTCRLLEATSRSWADCRLIQRRVEAPK